jgi:hypothetical protein
VSEISNKEKTKCHVESRWNIFSKIGVRSCFREITSKTAFIFAVCVCMCWERRERSIIIFKWFFIWKKEILSLSHPRYRRLSHRLRHIRVKSFFLFGLHPYSTIPPLPQKTDISPLVEFFLKLNIKSSSFIQVKQFLRVLSLSLSSWKLLQNIWKNRNKKNWFVCVYCVVCGVAEVKHFFVLNGIKTDLTTTKKKHSGICLFWFYVFATFFFFF